MVPMGMQSILHCHPGLHLWEKPARFLPSSPDEAVFRFTREMQANLQGCHQAGYYRLVAWPYFPTFATRTWSRRCQPTSTGLAAVGERQVAVQGAGECGRARPVEMGTLGK